MTKMHFNDLYTLFEEKLLAVGFTEEKANLLATIFAENTRDGVQSHGIGRFPRFVKQVADGIVHRDAEPSLVSKSGLLEQWDGNKGPGPLNARASMHRAMELARQHGIGMVALRNTTHWMRGGTYGRMAAEAGFGAICWTNTVANMSPWGCKTRAIGNNPLVMALPGPEHPIVLDMAMSQFSYGKMELLAAEGGTLPYPGGFDQQGDLTKDPKAILETAQVLPIGMWKGSGLSIMLDLFASTLSGGACTSDISTYEDNSSQLYMAFRLDTQTSVAHALASMQAACAENNETFVYPGLGVARTRQRSETEGVSIPEPALQAVHDL